MQQNMWTRVVFAAVCAMFVGACTASEAQTAGTAAPSPSTAASEAPWPGHYAEGEEGLWSVELTRSEILDNSRDQGVDERCVRDFIDAVGVKRTLAWNLYLRDGHWVLYGSLDGRKEKPFDGGTYYMPHIEKEWAVFTSTAPGIRDDVWLYPSIEGDVMTLGLLDVAQWTGAKSQWPVPDDPYCFIQGGSVVELTNPFQRVA